MDGCVKGRKQPEPKRPVDWFWDSINAMGAIGRISVFLLLLAPAARSQTEFMRSYLDQKLILRHVGDNPKVKVKQKDLAAVKGVCDIAVEVKQAAWNRGTAQLRLEPIGTLLLIAGKRQGNCKMIGVEISLEIDGFASNEPPDSVSAAIGEILQTPEQYLAAHGVEFKLPPGSEDEPATKPVIQPKILFQVIPEYTEAARKSKYRGTVITSFVVGTDGRIHRPRTVKGAGMGLDENVLKVLTLWRFEPARQNDRPVAAESTVENTFNLY